jgi:AraC-like DNA-binding protein
MGRSTRVLVRDRCETSGEPYQNRGNLESLAHKQQKMRQRLHPHPAPPLQPVRAKLEPEYNVNEAAQLLGLSRWTVTRMFEREPGVRIYGNENSSRNRRRQRTLRIPEYVLRRVQERRTVR